MRGKVFMRVIDSDGEGITPAYAGKRVPKIPQTQRMRDHPRLCGEKLTAPETKKGGTGSPPPMRGKVSGELLDINQYGITPAYAGKSIIVDKRAGWA